MGEGVDFQEAELAKPAASDIIFEEKAIGGNPTVQFVGEIRPDIYKIIEPEMQKTQVVITERQILHIKERHPDDYERFAPYLPQIIGDPDYILEANRPHTAFVLKSLEDGENRFEVILRLKSSDDPAEYFNSIITFLKVDRKRYERYLRTKKILYKKE